MSQYYPASLAEAEQDFYRQKALLASISTEVRHSVYALAARGHLTFDIHLKATTEYGFVLTLNTTRSMPHICVPEEEDRKRLVRFQSMLDEVPLAQQTPTTWFTSFLSLDGSGRPTYPLGAKVDWAHVMQAIAAAKARQAKADCTEALHENV